MNEPTISQAAAAMGRKGGSVKSEAKRKAAQAGNAARWAGHVREPKQLSTICTHENCFRATRHESGLCGHHRKINEQHSEVFNENQ